MTLGQFRKSVAHLSDDIKVVGKGHYGEELEVYSIQLGKVSKGIFGDKGDFTALIITMEYAGEEPD